jgi:adenylosuccinate lyase
METTLDLLIKTQDQLSRTLDLVLELQVKQADLKRRFELLEDVVFSAKAMVQNDKVDMPH